VEEHPCEIKNSGKNDFFLNTEPLIRNLANEKKFINVSSPLHQAVVF